MRSHIITEYGPSTSVKTGAFFHSGLISSGVRPGYTAHERLEAVAALRHVGIVLDVAGVHGLVGQLQVAVLQHVLQFLGGHRQGLSSCL